MTAATAEDPQTLRMVAGAMANLFGNGKLLILSHFKLPSLSALQIEIITSALLDNAFNLIIRLIIFL